MPGLRLAANISFLFADLPFADRFGAAARAGFAGVECLFPYDEMPARDYARHLDEHDLSAALINVPPGDWAGGERGLAALPGREADFYESVDRALDYADAIDCPRLHCLAGVPAPDADALAVAETYAANLSYAADRARDLGMRMLIEPINTGDMPGYHLSSPARALEILGQLALPNLALQYDLYHAEIIAEQKPADFIADHIDAIGHVQVAGVPERNEPDGAAPDVAAAFDALEGAGYGGWIGLEYRPRGNTIDGLGWASNWLRR